MGDRRLRVALVTSSYNFIADGVALTLNRLVAFLESRGVDVLVVAPVARKPAFAHVGEIAPAPSAPFPFRPEYRLSFGLTAALRGRLAEFRPDIVHLATPDLLGAQAMAFGRRIGAPVVASYHTRYETYLKDYGLGVLARPVGAWVRRFYCACDEIYAPSQSMIEALRAEGYCDKMRLWGRGVDTVRFTPARRSQDFRARIGVESDTPVVAFVGRLVREKRLDTLISVGARVGDARLLVVGDGPDRAMLERALPNAVFTGFLAGEDLPTAYASADVFLFPSDTETFGAVTLEAMASGLPTVCADATGSRSLVEHGVTGFLAPAGDDAAFLAAVEPLLASSELRRRMGAAARARSEDYSWDADMARLLARYEALAAAPLGAAAARPPVVDAPPDRVAL